MEKNESNNNSENEEVEEGNEENSENSGIIDLDEDNTDKNENKKNENKKNENKKKNITKNINEVNGIFISGIPYSAKEEEIKELFSKYGEITSFKLPRYQDSGKLIGYCHIYYKSKESAKKSLELDNYTLKDRYLKVELAKMSSNDLDKTEKINPNDVPINCVTAFIRNLPYDSTEKEIGDKFRSCGKIKGIRLVYNSKNKQFKGFCYIDFKEHKGLLKALELNGKDFNGRKLKVDFEQGKPKKGYKLNYDKIEGKYNKESISLLNRKRKNKK